MYAFAAGGNICGQDAYRLIQDSWCLACIGEVVQERWRKSPTTIPLKMPSAATSKFRQPKEQ